MLDYIFYCIYYGSITPGKKRRTPRKVQAVNIFSAVMYGYLIFFAFILSNIILPETYKLTTNIISIILIVIAISVFVLCDRVYNYDRINLIEDKYKGRISLMKARVVKYALIFSLPSMLWAFILYAIL